MSLSQLNGKSSCTKSGFYNFQYRASQFAQILLRSGYPQISSLKEICQLNRKMVCHFGGKIFLLTGNIFQIGVKSSQSFRSKNSANFKVEKHFGEISTNFGKKSLFGRNIHQFREEIFTFVRNIHQLREEIFMFERNIHQFREEIFMLGRNIHQFREEILFGMNIHQF